MRKTDQTVSGIFIVNKVGKVLAVARYGPQASLEAVQRLVDGMAALKHDSTPEVSDKDKVTDADSEPSRGPVKDREVIQDQVKRLPIGEGFETPRLPIISRGHVFKEFKFDYPKLSWFCGHCEKRQEYIHQCLNCLEEACKSCLGDVPRCKRESVLNDQKTDTDSEQRIRQLAENKRLRAHCDDLQSRIIRLQGSSSHPSHNSIKSDYLNDENLELYTLISDLEIKLGVLEKHRKDTGRTSDAGSLTLADEPKGRVPGEVSSNAKFSQDGVVEPVEDHSATQNWPSEARHSLNYLGQLAKFHRQRGQSLTSFPIVDERPLDLYKLKLAVETRGGFGKACEEGKWVEIGKDLGYTEHMSLLAILIRDSYQEWILPYDEEYQRLLAADTQSKPPSTVESFETHEAGRDEMLEENTRNNTSAMLDNARKAAQELLRKPLEPQDGGDYSPTPTKRIRQWFVPSEGINHEVIKAHLQLYLGPDAELNPVLEERQDDGKV